MNRREVEKEIESLDVESRRVAELLGGLKRVEAPSNFEFGVRARIANRESVRRWSVTPVLKLAAPLSLVLLVAVIAVIYQMSSNVSTVQVDDAPSAPSFATSFETPSTVSGPEISNNSGQVSGPREADLPDDPVSDPPALQGSKPNVARRDSNSDRRSRRPGTSDNVSDGGSRVDALRPANTINPPEFRGTTRNTQNSNSGNQTEVPVREVLEILGVSADPGDDGWKVKSTVDGSMARKSGIQSGDVIEAIDGRAVTRSTTFKGAFSGKTIRVRRDGKSVDVKLTN